MAKSYSLTKLSLAIGMVFASTATNTMAEITTANDKTQVSTKSGVEIVNIATPSQSGLSHNKYDKYNVGNLGAVLNNARQGGQSQLAGQLEANPNLKTQSATVILNEVVSRNPSVLAGKQEVFGQKADYVLANPNGITANGAEFINTPRASLVVGKPQVNQGKLNGYDVTGNKSLTAGKVTTTGNLDLIAPQVNLQGGINVTEDVNVIMGRNKITRNNQGALTVSQVQQKGKVLDGAILGSMQAGRIRVHSTDDRATITATGADLNAQDISITAGSAKLQGKITTANNQSSSNRTEGRRVKVEETSQSSQQSYKATQVKADHLQIQTRNSLDLSGANVKAKQATLTGSDVNLNAEKTVSTSQHNKNQSKGLWYRKEQETSHKEDVHRTTVAADEVKIVATQGKVTAEGAKISLTNGGIYGEKGVQLQGVTASNKSSAEATFKNETARLRTGSSSQNSVDQTYTATEITAKNDLVVGSGAGIQLSGVKARVDGDAQIKAQGKVSFDAEKTTQSHQVNDKEKYWGGLAGSKTVGSGKNVEVVRGADLSVKGNTEIDAQGVSISGSRVVSGKDGIVKGNQGSLVIDAVQAEASESEEYRKGTIFNITKARKNNFQRTSTSAGSELKSESNLRLVTDKNVNVIGSNIQSENALEIAALSGINVQGAQNSEESRKSSAGFSVGGAVDSFSATFTDGYVSGNVNLTNSDNLPSVSSDITIYKTKQESAVDVNAKFHAGLNAYSNSKETQTHNYTASAVSGGSVKLNAQNVSVAGSQVVAKAGDLAIAADRIVTQAQQNHSTINQANTTVALGLNGSVTNNKLSTTLGVDVAHELNSTHTSQAQTSQLSAANNLTLKANQINHQGTALEAAGSVQQQANEITQNTAKNTENSFTRKVNVSAGVTTSIDTKKVFNAETSLAATGERETVATVTHQGTQISAGKNVNVKANHIQDTATAYNAANNVELTSARHNLASAQNESQNANLSAGGNVSVSVSTADFQTYNVGVTTGANYQQAQSQTTGAVQSAINGKNVRINTETLNSQANINAVDNVAISATKTANFEQSNNSTTQSGGGFEASVGVGAIVIPAATAATPTVDVELSVNGNKGQSTTAVTNSISGSNIQISSNQVNLQGTNLNASQSAKVSGSQISISAARQQTKNVAVAVGGAVSIGENLGSAGAKGNLSVNHENSQTATGVTVNAQNLSIQAQNGVNLNGVSSESNQLNLDAGKGDLSITSAQNQVNKTDFSTSLSLDGCVAECGWTPTAGAASLAVNAVRNQTQTSSQLKTNSATINAAGNTKLSGSTISANSASGKLGNVHNETLSNSVKETKVNLSADGSGKVSLYTADNWKESAKKDWNNGTILGVKADSTIEINATRKRTNSSAGISAAKNNVVTGATTQNQAATTKNKVVKFKISPTTQLKTKVLKSGTGVNVQFVENNELVLKAQKTR